MMMERCYVHQTISTEEARSGLFVNLVRHPPFRRLKVRSHKRIISGVGEICAKGRGPMAPHNH